MHISYSNIVWIWTVPGRLHTKNVLPYYNRSKKNKNYAIKNYIHLCGCVISSDTDYKDEVCSASKLKYMKKMQDFCKSETCIYCDGQEFRYVILRWKIEYYWVKNYKELKSSILRVTWRDNFFLEINYTAILNIWKISRAKGSKGAHRKLRKRFWMETNELQCLKWW